MEREKILVNFRTFRTYKNGLDKLAEKRGFTVTQYLNHLIFDEIKVDLMKEADECAIRDVIIQYGLPDRFFIMWRDHHHDLNSELESVLKKEKARECMKKWADIMFKNIEAACHSCGFEANDVEYAEVMKAFSERI
jgi:hypothetical protein